MPVNLEGEDLLYNLAYECEGLFDQVQETFQKTKSEVATIELCAEFQQRFAVWTAHLGVFARKSQCLDTRLQNHPDLQDLVARLLDILRRSLQQCTIDKSSQGEGDAVPTAALKTIDDTLARLNRLGVTIRQSGRGKFDTRVKKFAAGLDLSSFASLCANAVQTLYPGAHQSLKDYLSRSMTDRYEKMLFLGFRRRKLETRRERELLTGLSPIHEIPNEETQTSAAIIRLAMTTANPIVANLPRPPLALSQSDLSSVNVYQIRNRLRPPDEASTKFHKTSSIQVNQGNYPRPPATNQSSGIFACQWCSEVLSKKTLSESEWRKHVDRDLKPYICLSEECSEAYPAYPTFDEWFKHMELHDWRWHQQVYLTSSWVCTVCEFNQDVYGSPQALYSHLEESHRGDFTNAQLQAISRQSKTEQPRASNDCLLCCFAIEGQGNNEEAVFPKRRKSQPKQEASKSARKTLEMTNPNSHGSDLEFSDTSSDSDDVGSRQHRRQRNKDRSKALTRHVAVHLQVLMLLTLRFAEALQDDDGDLDDGTKSDSVDIDEGNSASMGTDLGRLSHIGSEADVTMRDGQDGNDAENTDGAMEIDEDVHSNIVDEDIPIPDTDLDLDFIPRQYDDLLARDDKFLNKVIESGAYQSWRDQPHKSLFRLPSPDALQEYAASLYSISISPQELDKYTKKPEIYFKDMNTLLITHITKLQSSLFFALLTQCRKALDSFQQELNTLSQIPAIDSLDLLHCFLLSGLYYQLESTLLKQQRLLYTSAIRDPNHSNEFCKSITNYKGRLIAIKSYILEERENEVSGIDPWLEGAGVKEPSNPWNPEDIPLDILQVDDYYYKQYIRILIRPLIKSPNMRLDPGGDNCQWVSFRADAASLNKPKYEVLAITQTSEDTNFTFRIPGSAEDDLLWPPLWCEFYFDPASDIIIFMNKSEVPVSVSQVSHAANRPSLNKHYIINPGLGRALWPDTFRIKLRDVAVLDVRVLEKRPISSSDKLSSREKNSEESSETEEDFSPRLKRVGHVEFDKIAETNAETNNRPPKLKGALPLLQSAVVSDDGANAKKLANGVMRNIFDKPTTSGAQRWCERFSDVPPTVIERYASAATAARAFESMRKGGAKSGQRDRRRPPPPPSPARRRTKSV